MPDVLGTRLTTTARRRRLAAAAIASAATGAATAAVRPWFRGPIHYEAVAALFVVLPLISLTLALSLKRVPWRRALGWLALELLAVCIAFPVGYWLAPGAFPDEILGIMSAFWVIAAATCAALLVVWQWFHRPVAGPYCPACAYCLIGAPTDRCPECGRDFDVRELGITRDELRPPAKIAG
jgi:hypothetical protein